MPHTVIDRLVKFMEFSGLNDNLVTEAAGLSIGLLGKARKNNTGLRSDSIEKILYAYPNLNPTWLLTGRGNMVESMSAQMSAHPVRPNVRPIDKTKDQKLILKEPDPDYKIRHLVVTANPSGRENITLVPVKAQAGYLIGSGDKEYIEHLPQFWLPGLSNGTFRAFEVSGYSMLADRIGFFPGDIVIGEYVEKLDDIKDGQVYIIVNNAQEVDDIVLKRCLNYMDKGGVIICKSDNKDPQYPTFPLQAEAIKEVWRFKMKLTRQAPEPSGLYERMNGIEGEVVLLKEKIKNLLDLKGI
jgi:hypothetical protein